MRGAHAPLREPPWCGGTDPTGEASAALLLRDGGLAGLAQLGGVLTQTGGDAATTGLHVGTKARHLRLAGLARRLELLADLVDVRLALGRELLRVLLQAGPHPGATGLRPGTEAGDVGCARTLRRGGGCLLGERGTGAERDEKDEGCGREDGTTHRVNLLGKRVPGFPHRTQSE